MSNKISYYKRLETSKDSLDFNASTWSNAVNNFGVQTDPNASTIFLRGAELNSEQLDILYKFNPLVNKYVNSWRADSTRKSFELVDEKKSSIGSDVKKDLKKRFKIDGLLSKCVGIERLHGGGVIYCDIEDGNKEDEPLNEKTVSKINGFIVVEKQYARPHSYNELIGSEDAGEPEHYQITLSNAANSKTFTVHRSRLIRIPEMKSDDNLTLLSANKSSYPSWPISPIQKAYDAIKRYDVSLQSISQHLQNLVVDIYKVSNLGTKKDPEAFRKYIREQKRMSSSMKATIISENDSIERVGTPIQGIEFILDAINKDVAMALDMSLSFVFSLEAGGLGGSQVTGDRLNWFDKVKSYQVRHLVCVVERIVELLGFEQKKDYSDLHVEFNSLHELSDKEKAEVQGLHIDNMLKLVSIGYSAKDALDSMLSSGKFDLDAYNYNPELIEDYNDLGPTFEDDQNDDQEDMEDGEEG